eukprot:TRINITY_DN13922_c4_g1_i1.p1 TRINITY_DN13922_c4_g1~~TRINITY_DN13922_c4_g1_i1.p1  ORF type:complete len:709 (+),score=139.23 TRINITY_DN13922_c4_g1_i1:124-2127(+)
MSAACFASPLRDARHKLRCTPIAAVFLSRICPERQRSPIAVATALPGITRVVVEGETVVIEGSQRAVAAAERALRRELGNAHFGEAAVGEPPPHAVVRAIEQAHGAVADPDPAAGTVALAAASSESLSAARSALETWAPGSSWQPGPARRHPGRRGRIFRGNAQRLQQAAADGGDSVARIASEWAGTGQPIDGDNCAALLQASMRHGRPLEPTCLLYVAEQIRSEPRLNPREISDALCGLRRTAPVHAVEAVIEALVPHIAVCEQIKAAGIGLSLLGLQRLSWGAAASGALRVLLPHARRCQQEGFGRVAAGNALFGLQRLADCPEAPQLLAAIADGLRPPVLLGSTLYPLANYGDRPEVRSLLRALLAAADPAEVLSPGKLGAALYGLHNQEDTVEVRAVLHALAGLATRCTGKARPADLGSAFYGLRGQPGTAAARAVLSALCELLQRCDEPFDAQAVANVAYGLQGQPAVPEVSAVIGALAPAVAACRETLQPTQLGSALYGLQQQPPSAAMRALIGALAANAAAGPAPDGRQGGCIGIALYGMQMQEDSAEVRALYRQLAQRLLAAPEPLTPQQVGNALYGLQGQQGTSDGLQQLLYALAPLVRSCPEPLTYQNIVMGLYGLRGLVDTKAVDIIDHLTLLAIPALASSEREHGTVRRLRLGGL